MNRARKQAACSIRQHVCTLLQASLLQASGAACLRARFTRASPTAFLLKISEQIINSAIKVHRELGPGLLESIYEAALTIELEMREFNVQRQLPFSVFYKNTDLKTGYRLDLLVNDCVIIELKFVGKVGNYAARETVAAVGCRRTSMNAHALASDRHMKEHFYD